MKILWIKSDFPLPADTGGKIRTKNLLFELAKECEVTFLSYAPPGLDSRWHTEMEQAGITPIVVAQAEEHKAGLAFMLRVASKLLSPRPYVVNKYVSTTMAEAINSLLQERTFDVAVCDFLEMAWCADLLKGVPAVLFEHNVESMIWRRHYQVARNPVKKLYLAYEKGRVARFELEACNRFDSVLTVSDEDGAVLTKESALGHYRTIPTGVDTAFFRPRDGEIPNRLILSGSMDWMPNIDAFWWFYRSIYPKVRNEMPDVTLTVVGRRPPADIVAVAQADPSVEVTGTVDDVRPHVAAGALFLVPLRVGGGTRIKIYEAMAMKKCVVATSIGAEGLPLTDNVDIALADTEADFAKKVRELLRDNSKRDRIADAGYRLVTEHYSWVKAAAILHDSLKKTAAAKSGKAKQGKQIEL
jgi:glycosyltransferase involved in cell wall biosynthesis